MACVGIPGSLLDEYYVVDGQKTRLTKAIFGSSSPPFFLGGVGTYHKMGPYFVITVKLSTEDPPLPHCWEGLGTMAVPSKSAPFFSGVISAPTY